MKIGIFAISDIPLGKQNIKDPRLDEVDKITKSKKKTYVQVELVGEDGLLEADAILTQEGSRTDLILRDLEFVETRLGRTEDAAEKALLAKMKSSLEKEETIMNAGLSEEEKKSIANYNILTHKPIIAVGKQELEDLNSVLAKAMKEAGYISFFTTGEKDTRAWLIKKGVSSWEASGAIHSDIQKGFIRAEIIALSDFLQAGGETQAKQAGKMRLEQKDYVMQDGDLTNFRFNK